ncbi:MAG: GDP-mannose 4,6-dehydratase [Altibacter sp.]|uniref:GDP-mannose 4,6-dehydratase n=1 Tax=Altibacter sp. TaxID=2024823 RepID=UPI000C98F4D7|nr:GDP-mannose 4,6-dehydratase [Altibacter sp.]MAP55901.1 GDP-mannose 4,6-dehydratase [Altibacter sp.]|tara:strand:- start:1021 stop:1983 length:963 start_codon:yes stop_codon:yes gene_type:complete
MKKIALITGISGQDGSYLSELLLAQGYEVHGIIRRNSLPENQDSRIKDLDVITHYGDLLDAASINRIVNEVQPDEVYNLAAQSHVRISFDMPSFTIQTNALGVLNMLEACRSLKKRVKFYQASSSEMFGNSIDEDGYQRKTTPMNPTSPYGCAKVMAYNLCKHYRKAYDMHVCNGILFNHESPRRGSNFVTNKIVKGAVEIKKGKRKTLALGNLDASRDWGHSKDYVKAMHLITNHESPSDWTVATGESRTIRDMCEITFKVLDMDYRDYITIDSRYLRPHELNFLKGDSSEIRNVLGWKPEYTFDSMVGEMVNHWMEII